MSNPLTLCYGVAVKSISLAAIVLFAGPSLLAQTPQHQDSAANIARQVSKVHAETAETNTQVPFHASWDSLAQYRTPDWFRDAKFGIFLHWGVYSVPAFANGLRRAAHHRRYPDPRCHIPFHFAERFSAKWLDFSRHSRRSQFWTIPT